MKVIGITGGVGAGKSEVLKYLQKHPSCRIIMTDRLAEELQQPGGPCLEPLRALLGDTIISKESGGIDRPAMAALVFKDPSMLQKVNAIVHPIVHNAVMEIISDEKKRGLISFLFIESALFIGAGYDDIMDEMWYIYADRQVRIERLMASRGYTRQKAEDIMNRQPSDDEFRSFCDRVIDNSGSIADLEKQLNEELKWNQL